MMSALNPRFLGYKHLVRLRHTAQEMSWKFEPLAGRYPPGTSEL